MKRNLLNILFLAAVLAVAAVTLQASGVPIWP